MVVIMKLSIIIPAYNNANFITECLDSVIDSWKDNYEIIIIDDYSTDNTYSIINDYKKKHENINILLYKNDKNMGAGYTKNRGLSLAKGEYIGFLDSDDFVDDKYYEKMIELTEKYNADIVVSDIAILSEDGIEYEKISKGNFSNEKLSGEIINANLVLGHWSAASACTKIFKRIIVNRFQFATNKCDDLIFTIPALCNANKIVYCDNNFYYYRVNKNSLTRTLNINKYIDSFTTIFETIKILNNNKKMDEMHQLMIISFLPLMYEVYTMPPKKKRILFNHIDKLINDLDFSFSILLNDNRFILNHDEIQDIKYMPIVDYILTSQMREYTIY